MNRYGVALLRVVCGLVAAAIVSLTLASIVLLAFGHAQPLGSQQPGFAVQPQPVLSQPVAPDPSPLLAAQLQILDLRAQLSAARAVMRQCQDAATATAEVNLLPLQRAFSQSAYDTWVASYEKDNPGWTWDLAVRVGKVKPAATTAAKP